MIRTVTVKAEVETSEDIEHRVVIIIGSLTKDAECFQYSSNLYNSDFFRDETPEMKLGVCTALANFFAPDYSNSYWNSNKLPV